MLQLTVRLKAPFPIPSDFVVKNVSKIRSISSGAIPDPESSTATRTPLSPWFSDRTRSTRARSETETMASIAFMIRFRMTCRNWIRSARTRGRSSASSARLDTPRSLRSPCTRVITSRISPLLLVKCQRIVLGGQSGVRRNVDVIAGSVSRCVQNRQRNACRIAVGVLPVQRLKACVNALTSW